MYKAAVNASTAGRTLMIGDVTVILHAVLIGGAPLRTKNSHACALVEARSPVTAKYDRGLTTEDPAQTRCVVTAPSGICR